MRTTYENTIRMSIPNVIAQDQISRLTAAGDLGLIDQRRIDAPIWKAASKEKGAAWRIFSITKKNFSKRELKFDL